MNNILDKKTGFLWGWNDYRLMPDTLMTRERCAKLLRSYRRLMRNPANYKPIVSLDRVAPHTYKVVHQCGESATIAIV